MKKILAFTALLFAFGCGDSAKPAGTSDTTVNTAAPGNSDGSNIVASDTAHMDTTLGKIKSDSAK